MKAILGIFSLIGLIVVAVIVMKQNTSQIASVGQTGSINKAKAVQAKMALTTIGAQMKTHYMQHQSYLGVNLSQTVGQQSMDYMVGVLSQSPDDYRGFWGGQVEDELIDIVDQFCSDCRIEKDAYKIIALRFDEQDQIDAWMITHTNPSPRPISLD